MACDLPAEGRQSYQQESGLNFEMLVNAEQADHPMNHTICYSMPTHERAAGKGQ